MSNVVLRYTKDDDTMTIMGVHDSEGAAGDQWKALDDVRIMNKVKAYDTHYMIRDDDHPLVKRAIDQANGLPVASYSN